MYIGVWLYKGLNLQQRKVWDNQHCDLMHSISCLHSSQLWNLLLFRYLPALQVNCCHQRPDTYYSMPSRARRQFWRLLQPDSQCTYWHRRKEVRQTTGSRPHKSCRRRRPSRHCDRGNQDCNIYIMRSSKSAWCWSRQKKDLQNMNIRGLASAMGTDLVHTDWGFAVLLLIYGAIWNDCRGFNNLPYTVHLR